MARFSEKKALAAILYLANKIGKIDLYALLKTLYYAEKYHFQQWGRTITGDTLCRLPYGPVPSRAYDMLKSVRGDGLWPHDLSEDFAFANRLTVIPRRAPNLNSLSQTDIEMLDRSFAERGLLSFRELCDEAHKDPAFLHSKELRMTEEDLSEEDPILLEHLKEARENEWFLNNWRYFLPRDEETFCEEPHSEGDCHNSGCSRPGT